MTRTTPPRPVDITRVLPPLAPLARTATRLHPRPGTPSVDDSSIGGPLLWPATEPWPLCDGLHTWEGGFAMPPVDVRLERILRASRGRSMTPREQEAFDRLQSEAVHPPDEPVLDAPVVMLPVAQLYARDVPDLRAPEGADLLQVLWCPCDHPPDQFMPRTMLVWRSAAAVTDILIAPPEPGMLEYGDYLPEPCLLEPEQVTEYPHHMELDKDLRERLGRWSTWQAADATPDSSYEVSPESFYGDELSVAPGWKVGGWASWGLTDPVPRFCPACDTRMDPLLTIATYEWQANTHGWIPFEVQGAVSTPSSSYPHPRTPTAVQIASGHRQQLYVCPADPEHPHTELMQ